MQIERVNSGKSKGNTVSGFIFKLLENRVVSLIVIIFLMSLVMSIIFPKNFPTSSNIKAVVLNMSIDAIASIGMMILLISGVFDLSVGSVLAVSGAIACNFMFYYKMNMWAAIMLAMVICALIGLFNGVFIAKIGVNPMIVTLSTMGIVRGMAILFAGTGISDLPDGFLKIADMSFLGVRASIWYMIILVTAFTVLVSKSKFFRRYYYIGGNEKAASLSGINVPKMRIISFIISASLAGLAGIIFTSRLGAAVSGTGTSLEMRAITASILGGASLSGGTGSIVGVALGALFMGLIQNLMIIAKISVYWQSIITGLILLLAVTSDVLIIKHQSNQTIQHD